MIVDPRQVHQLGERDGAAAEVGGPGRRGAVDVEPEPEDQVADLVGVDPSLDRRSKLAPKLLRGRSGKLGGQQFDPRPVDPRGGAPDLPAVVKKLDANLEKVPSRVLSPAGKLRVPKRTAELREFLINLRRESDDLAAL